MRKLTPILAAGLLAVSPGSGFDAEGPIYGPVLNTILVPKGSIPKVGAKSALVMDARTGKVLWAKDADSPRYPASTTKIMTALLLIERTKPEDILVAPADVNKVPESSMNLKPGERVSARDMLYALLLRSANDGAYTVAVNVGGSVEGFARMMNERARALGATKTNFTNPHGLRDDKHQTTARDLAIIAREAMTHPDFAQAARTYKYKITRSINQGDTMLVSHNKALKKDPTTDGIKTGFTIPAGKCFVGSATRNGYRLITVVLKSDDWQSDNEQMLAWAFASHERTMLAQAGKTFGSAEVEGGTTSQVPAVLARDVDTITRRGKQAAVRVRLRFSQNEAPIARGERVGIATFIEDNGFAQDVPLLAAADVPEASFLWSTSGLLWIGGGAAGTTALLRRRTRRRRIHARIARTSSRR